MIKVYCWCFLKLEVAHAAANKLNLKTYRISKYYKMSILKKALCKAYPLFKPVRGNYLNGKWEQLS